MVEADIVIGLVVERIELRGPWSDHVWMPVQVLPGAPDTPAWTVLGRGPDRTRYYAGAYPVKLYSTETEFYRDNLASRRPSLWVVMRPTGLEPSIEILTVTADPTEGEGLTQTGTYVVEAIDLPPVMAQEIAAFIEAHHVERVFEKRKRDRRRPGIPGREARGDDGKS